MKSNSYYGTLSAKKRAAGILESLYGKKVKSSKVRQMIIRDMKRNTTSTR